MNTAIFLKGTQTGAGPFLQGFRGDARLYKLSKPVYYGNYGERKKRTSFVVVSGASAMFSGLETYIFPADKKGKVLNWMELDGSFQGTIDHARALKGAGYKIKGG